MNSNYLDFEQPIAELDAKIEALRLVDSDSHINISEEIGRLEAKSGQLLEKIFSKLTSWQVAQLARHPARPYFLDYVERIFTDFDELHGDRTFGDDHAIVGGVARLNGNPVMLIGQQKGRDTKDKIYRNFSMMQPEGYRKAKRLMQMAEKFSMPVITFIDTLGAYPGIDAEARGQSEAIARNLFEMAKLKTPIISIVIGEGNSGGALGIGVGDRVLMLQYSYYATISPEGCASILFRSAEKAPEAAEIMGITADKLIKLGLIDAIVAEPVGGAHRDVAKMSSILKTHIVKHLTDIKAIPRADLVDKRYERWMALGE